MVDLLGAGLAWLERQRASFMTKPVTYRRGALEFQVHATVGKTIFEVVTAAGVIERIEARDFLIPAAELVALGIPQRGDRIIESQPGFQYIHEVLAPGREPHWRWSDPNRLLYRIHTKYLQTETEGLT